MAIDSKLIREGQLDGDDGGLSDLVASHHPGHLMKALDPSGARRAAILLVNNSAR